MTCSRPAPDSGLWSSTARLLGKAKTPYLETRRILRRYEPMAGFISVCAAGFRLAPTLSWAIQRARDGAAQFCSMANPGEARLRHFAFLNLGYPGVHPIVTSNQKKKLPGTAWPSRGLSGRFGLAINEQEALSSWKRCLAMSSLLRKGVPRSLTEINDLPLYNHSWGHNS